MDGDDKLCDSERGTEGSVDEEKGETSPLASIIPLADYLQNVTTLLKQVSFEVVVNGNVPLFVQK